MVRYTHIGVCVVYEHSKGRQQFLDSRLRRGWVLVAAEVHNDPSDVAQKRDGNIGSDECQQRLDDAQTNDIVTTLRTITCTVTYICLASYSMM